MPGDRSFELRQIDGARTDFALIAADIDFLKKRLARLPSGRMSAGSCSWRCSAVLD
jgi:hypothetical protein